MGAHYLDHGVEVGERFAALWSLHVKQPTADNPELSLALFAQPFCSDVPAEPTEQLRDRADPPDAVLAPDAHSAPVSRV